MNREELRTILDQRGVPQTSYSLVKDNCKFLKKGSEYLLEYDPGMKTWDVRKYVQGEDKLLGFFYSEAGACEKLYYALTNTNKDFVRLLDNLPFEKPRNLRDEINIRDLKDWLLMNAGATAPRLVANVMQLKELLVEKGIPNSAYSIRKDDIAGLDHDGGRLLDYNEMNDYWSLWIIEGGERGCVYSSCSETMACTMLYYLLVDGLHKASRPLGEPQSVMNRTTGLFHRSSDSAIRNCDELEKRLIKADVRFWCTLPGDPPWNEGWALEHNLREKTWDLFCHERGEKYLVNSFYWESTACEELYSAVIRLADPDRLR